MVAGVVPLLTPSRYIVAPVGFDVTDNVPVPEEGPWVGAVVGTVVGLVFGPD
jgi:hypothetical protein